MTCGGRSEITDQPPLKGRLGIMGPAMQVDIYVTQWQRTREGLRAIRGCECRWNVYAVVNTWRREGLIGWRFLGRHAGSEGVSAVVNV